MHGFHGCLMGATFMHHMHGCHVHTHGCHVHNHGCHVPNCFVKTGHEVFLGLGTSTLYERGDYCIIRMRGCAKPADLRIGRDSRCHDRGVGWDLGEPASENQRRHTGGTLAKGSFRGYSRTAIPAQHHPRARPARSSVSSRCLSTDIQWNSGCCRRRAITPCIRDHSTWNTWS